MWWVPQKLSQKSTSPSFCRSTEHSKTWKFTSARSPPVCVWMYTVGSSSKIHTLALLCTLEMRVWQVTGMWDSETKVVLMGATTLCKWIIAVNPPELLPVCTLPTRGIKLITLPPCTSIRYPPVAHLTLRR